MKRSYRTPKGTELPLLNLRGKEYLEVKFRLVWFREDKPEWGIETEALQLLSDSAYFRAVIKDEKGRIVCVSHKYEDKKGFPDFAEKAETGAIGRALALLGYGTQFCADELDEGERIVDSPVDPVGMTKVEESNAKTPGDYVITFGKHENKTLKELGLENSKAYLNWLKGTAKSKNQPLSDDAKRFEVAVGRYENSLGGQNA